MCGRSARVTKANIESPLSSGMSRPERPPYAYHWIFHGIFHVPGVLRYSPPVVHAARRFAWVIRAARRSDGGQGGLRKLRESPEINAGGVI